MVLARNWEGKEAARRLEGSAQSRKGESRSNSSSFFFFSFFLFVGSGKEFIGKRRCCNDEEKDEGKRTSLGYSLPLSLFFFEFCESFFDYYLAPNVTYIQEVPRAYLVCLARWRTFLLSAYLDVSRVPWTCLSLFFSFSLQLSFFLFRCNTSESIDRFNIDFFISCSPPLFLSFSSIRRTQRRAEDCYRIDRKS